MKRIIVIALCLVCIVGTVSAYGLYVKCPDQVQARIPLKCSIDSDFPAGTTFDIVFYQTQYTATEINRQSVTVQENKATQYKLFDTRGLPGGNYKVEVRFIGADEPRLRSDSITLQLVKVIDRSEEITITSPESQLLDEALRIEGSIRKEGTQGVELEVRGPDGRIFGTQWIGTTDYIKTGDGLFTKKVAVYTTGDYEVHFTDSKGFIGIRIFHVQSPVTTTAFTSIPATTTKITTRTTTSVPVTPLPRATEASADPVTISMALLFSGLAAVFNGKQI